MLVCVIEFGTRLGMEERTRALLAELLVEAGKIDGFVSKESFVSKDRPDKTISISYWRDEAAPETWMANAEPPTGNPNRQSGAVFSLHHSDRSDREGKKVARARTARRVARVRTSRGG